MVAQNIYKHETYVKLLIMFPVRCPFQADTFSLAVSNLCSTSH